jgi:hypothetical protein
LADTPFWDEVSGGAVAPFGEDVGAELTEGFAHRLIIFDLEWDDVVDASNEGDDLAARFEILKGSALFGPQEGVAVDDDDEGVAQAFGFEQVAGVTGVDRIEAAGRDDDFPQGGTQTFDGYEINDFGGLEVDGHCRPF